MSMHPSRVAKDQKRRLKAAASEEYACIFKRDKLDFCSARKISSWNYFHLLCWTFQLYFESFHSFLLEHGIFRSRLLSVQVQPICTPGQICISNFHENSHFRRNDPVQGGSGKNVLIPWFLHSAIPGALANGWYGNTSYLLTTILSWLSEYECGF